MPSQNKRHFIDLFRQIQVKFSRLYTHILTKRNLTLPQYIFLNLLIETGPIPMSDAGIRLHISKPAVTHLTDQLEGKKMLVRLASPTDRRITTLKILPRGEKKAREVQGQTIKLILKSLERFKDEEQKIITSFYTHLMASVENELMRD